ncbi:apolipoprotein N-acyltransferase [Saccharothrix coeruleofusca]|uniref:apolipoprotein N-acyltransferase n=1 Tax=Saccharothrix coeruleofusca TaxID=33919 RepID=UPI001E3BC147|nr:apolipoprotein N-acyltransferase [Saccharothrix coeruleofusca]MBP2338330.1 apolipoprotein N-acyltransferase [Saccharothrix coeruleofusca]
MGISAGIDAVTKRVPGLARYAAAALAGVALHVAFPPRTLWWTAIVAFAVLWFTLRGVRVRRAALLGFVFGLGFFLPHLLWINDFLGRDFGLPPWLGLSALMALFTAATCALVPLVARLPAAPVWAALLFVLQESARSRVPANGFPWGRVAFGQVEGPYLPLAAIGGAPLVSFAVVVTGFGVAAWAARPRDPRRAWAVLPLAAALAVTPLVGVDAQHGERTVAVVQGNAPDVGLGLLHERDTLRRNHLRATAELTARIRAGEVPRPDLVVWPESATGAGERDPVLDRAVAELGVPTLIGALRRVDGREENAVIAWDPRTGAGPSYAKQELVPFGEYIPMRSLATLVTPFAEAPDLSAGTEPGVFDIAGTRVGVGICYEAAYDAVLRESAAEGARLFVVPTNNAWYGPGEMTYQQLGMARLRAVEHGRAVVVAAISGVSAVVRPDGSVVRSTGMFTEDLLVESVPLRSDTTLATRFGGVLEALFALMALAGAGWPLLRGWRARQSRRSRSVAV